MRICYLADAQSVHTKHWLRYFVGKGHEIHLISFRPGEVPGASVHFARLPLVSSKLRYLFLIPRIRSLTKRIDPDLVHAHYVSSYGFVGAATSRHPFVVTAHGTDILIGAGRFSPRGIFVRYALGRADLVHSVAQHLTEKMILMGAAPEKVVTFQYGLDLGRFPPREVKGSDSIGPRVVSTRALEPVYRVDVLVKAAELVRSKYPDARFLIAGSGSEGKRCRRMVQERKLDGIVRFLGSLPNEEIPTLLSDSHIYVSCSVSDGAAISLLEAMASGCFPIVTDIPANRDWITHGRNGFLVPAGDDKALAEGITDAWRRRDLRERATSVNREIIEERAVWQRNMGSMETCYRQLLAG